MERLARLSLALVSLAVALSAATARADLYRWVDSQGNVHISDVPPPSGAASKVEAQPTEPAAETPAPPVERSTGGRYAGKGQSRIVALENVAMKFANESAEPRPLRGCGGRYTYLDASRWGSFVNYPSAFYGRLEELGYATPRSEELKFAREQKAEIELSAIAVVKDIGLDDCDRVGSLDVDWRVYDNLHRKVVLEVSVVGRDRVGSGEIRRSLLEAFADSVHSLAKDGRFQEIVSSDSQAVPAAAAMSQHDFPAMSLTMRFGESKAGFSTRVDALKTGTVTVRTTDGHGSGFVLSREGHVLTNSHVVGSSSKVVVVFDDQEIDATVVRADPVRDVALLKLRSASPAGPLQISRVIPHEGDTLYAMGTPLDEALSHTVTRGILSARRTIEGRPFYQTDAAINHGNSGGPIFDEHGDVVAIAVAGVFTKDAGATSINLLIPIQSALDALKVSGESPGVSR